MNRCLLVTGGGRGIGAEVSRKAVKLGYSVCINYLKNQTSAENLVDELNSKGNRAFVCQADVSKEEEVVGLFERFEEQFGVPDA
ncbi:MAG TPA: SDR family NAD(P)-dependent oxidoreductase, partial [SAR324 cluster bacterium]|nr:SDR family NAD(P)-dependent oxidoreductase [SAR324 cluster bacterium]